MKKHIFKAMQQSFIDSSFMDFYFPENIIHPFIDEMQSFQKKSHFYRLQILNAKNEQDLKMVADLLNTQLHTFDQLSKNDFSQVNYFFNTSQKNQFNFDYIKSIQETIYNNSSFLTKLLSTSSVNIPEQYIPSQEVKKNIFEEFAFKYLYIPKTSLSIAQCEQGYNNFIQQVNYLMKHIDKPKKAMSIYGELGVYLEDRLPLYGHQPKCIGFTKDIVPSTLLHEWTHALDNFVFHKLSGINHFASENTENFSIKNKNFLPIYDAIKKSLFEVCNEPNSVPKNLHEVIGSNTSIYYLNCRVADDELFLTPNHYFQQPCEILARMVESGEFNNYTEGRNKAMTSLVYLKDSNNPYSQLKDILFSVIDKPTIKMQEIRSLHFKLPKVGNILPK